MTLSYFIMCPFTLTSQVKDLREKVEEAESFGARKIKAQLSSAESRASSLEEQLDVATRYKFVHILYTAVVKVA